MGQTVPLGGVLEVHHDQVVADHVRLLVVIAKQTVIHIGAISTQGGTDNGRITSWIQ